MKMKSLVLLAMAIGCGLVAMLGVRQVLSGDKGAAVETVKVLVAVTGIMPGQPLDDTNVAFKDWPKDKVPQGAVTTPRTIRGTVVASRRRPERSHHGGQIERERSLRRLVRDSRPACGSRRFPSTRLRPIAA